MSRVKPTSRIVRSSIAFVLAFVVSALQSAAGMEETSEQTHTMSQDRTSDQNFFLTAHNERITLKAKDASLKAVLEELGRQMDIEVVAKIPPEETVTEEFSDLTLEQALGRLSKRNVYMTDRSQEDQRITKIVILPEGEQQTFPAPDQSSSSESKPEPFQFEFDPSEFMEQGEDSPD